MASFITEEHIKIAAEMAETAGVSAIDINLAVDADATAASISTLKIDPRVDIVLIWDMSGSTLSMGTEPISAYNSFVEDQKAAVTEDTGATLTFYIFNKMANIMYEGPLADAPLLTAEKWHPNQMTALHDAICEAIQKKRATDHIKNTIFVIMTDGQENASKTYNGNDVKRLISKMEMAHGCQFIYMAANVDAFNTGINMGFGATNCANYASAIGHTHGLAKLTRDVSAQVSGYRSASAAVSSGRPLLIPRVSLAGVHSSPPNMLGGFPSGHSSGLHAPAPLRRSLNTA